MHGALLNEEEAFDLQSLLSTCHIRIRVQDVEAEEPLARYTLLVTFQPSLSDF